ncbi:unnamed protein product [Spirodela intermedia]|uniref:Uncharacterized protein n=2 Tax=Spirodela intermedia TaxID=51605 RepID=A0A7I8LH61_SPIIN|nr:unnamed protein product [Spirodela intermedia]
MEPTGPPPPVEHSPIYQSLVGAGPRLRPLRQVHARMVVSGLHRSRSLLTKLLTLVIKTGPSGGAAAAYAGLLLHSVPNPDGFLFNSLIRVSSRSGDPLAALRLYRHMRQATLARCNYTFTSAVKACADLAALPTGREIHCHLLLDGLAGDVYVQTALVALYGKCGDLPAARAVFDGMPRRSLVTWNAMIAAYEQNGLAGEAVVVFRAMQADAAVEPDGATMVSLLAACAHLGDLRLGQWASSYIATKHLPVGAALAGALVSMYARCGCVDEAREVFDGLRRPNVVAWTAMISGYGMHGRGAEAVALFRMMSRRGPRPNTVTFVAVLAACAHAGLVVDGREAFESMQRDYGLLPREEHLVCMVDMLGRAGHLEEAFRFVRTAAAPPVAGAAMWTALVGACKLHRRFELGVEAAERLVAMESENAGNYVLLSNLCAMAGRTEAVEAARGEMARRGLRKVAGYSAVEVGGTAHVFRMGERRHPQAAEIYRFLEELEGRMREVGYSPETATVMHEVEEEEREIALRHHSEKLAVAFGIMSTAGGTAVRVVKNLRICGDCHAAVKLMSAVARREIIVRDKHRFHHFQGGSCSCGDFW